MKKIIDLKEVMIILISVVLIVISTNIFATEVVDPNEYLGAQEVPEDKNNIMNNSIGNNNISNNNIGNNNIENNNIDNNSTSNNIIENNNTGNNTVKKYNTNNKTDLPQTGIEDYNVGILLIICISSAIFAYKKVSDYRNI